MKTTLDKSLLKKIERLEAFEDRLRIRFENFSIKIDQFNWVTVFCEAYPMDGATFEEKIKIECVLYDQDGSILEVQTTYIEPKTFFGFEILTFNFQEDEIAKKVSKIRIFPNKY